ncbi:MAG: hypothetical protein IJV29_18685 [Butyrivibrio sp.]|nr:hypothetical protein [Butyrivibrio sp.]MBQ7431639.1 hypothetical protein [Butyrivibrio sp.]
MANYLVTTKEEYIDEDVKKGGLITKVRGSLKEYQKVVAVGPMVRNIQVGDLVCINPKRYARRKYQEGSLKDGVITENPVISYNFNVIELDHVSHLLLVDQDIDFVIEESEDEEVQENPIITPERKIIV